MLGESYAEETVVVAVDVVVNYIFVLGESYAEAAVVVPQRHVRLLLREPGGPRVDHEAVCNQGTLYQHA